MAIDVGSTASNRGSSADINGYTYITKDNPVNANGVITSVEVWANGNMTGLKVGTFFGSGTSWTNRDYETIGNVTAGSKQTFSGLSIDTQTNDLLGCVNTGGNIEIDTTGGSGHYWKQYDQFGAGTQTYTDPGYATTVFSLYATGISAATVTTQEESDVTSSGMVANGNITDTGGSGSDVTRRGFCYMEGTSGDPTTANSTAYDDGTFGAGAYTKSITGLSPSTSYRVRAYAVNAAGTAYGTTVDATTDASGTLYLTAIMSHKFIPPFLGGLN
jgi:hypothetical protein